MSVATLALMLVMFVGDRWESAEDTPDIPKVKHTPRLDEESVVELVEWHIRDDLAPEQQNDKWPDGALDNIQGYNCFWFDNVNPSGYWYINVLEHFINITYDETTDLWLLASVAPSCNDEQYPRMETWTVNDNTGEISYEVPTNEVLGGRE